MLLFRPNQNVTELWKDFEKELVVNGTVDAGVDYILRNSSWKIVSIGVYHYHLSKWFQQFSPSQVKHLYSWGKQNELPLHCTRSAPVQCTLTAQAVRVHYTGLLGQTGYNVPCLPGQTGYNAGVASFVCPDCLPPSP